MKEIFDVTKTGYSYYDDFLDPQYKDYFAKKNLYGEVVYMSPDEYIDLCVEYGGFQNTNRERIIKSRHADVESNENLHQLLKDGKKFWLPYVNKADLGQEGLHRAIIAKDLGYNKIPVLVVDNIDKEKAAKDKELERQYNLYTRIDRWFRLRENNTHFETTEDIIDEIDWCVNSHDTYIEGYTYKILSNVNNIIKIEIEGIPFIVTYDPEEEVISEVTCEMFEQQNRKGEPLVEKITKQLEDDQLSHLIACLRKDVTALGGCEVEYSIISDGLYIRIAAKDIPDYEYAQDEGYEITYDDEAYYEIEYTLFRDGRFVRYSQRPVEMKEECVNTFKSIQEVVDEVPSYIEDEISDIDRYVSETEDEIEAAEQDDDYGKEHAYWDWVDAEIDAARDERLWDDDRDEE